MHSMRREPGHNSRLNHSASVVCMHTLRLEWHEHLSPCVARAVGQQVKGDCCSCPPIFSPFSALCRAVTGRCRLKSNSGDSNMDCTPLVRRRGETALQPKSPTNVAMAPSGAMARGGALQVSRIAAAMAATIAAVGTCAGGAMAATGPREQAVDQLRGLSIEELADVQVTTVSRREEPLSQAPWQRLLGILVAGPFRHAPPPPTADRLGE